MADKGWIKLNRQIMDHWLWENHEYAFAWIDLLLLAEYKTHKKMWRGNITEFRRGNVYYSIQKLGERWGWSRKKVKHFLEQLEEDQMVHIKAHPKGTTITIVNYEFFQDKGTAEGTPKGTSEGTPKGTPEGTYLKNNKELNKNNKKVPITQFHNIEQHNYDFDELEKKLTGE